MENTQSYFGDVLSKLDQLARAQNIPVDQAFKAQLREELIAQDISEPQEAPREAVNFIQDEPVPSRPMVEEPVAREPEPEEKVVYSASMSKTFRRWQALFVGLPALLISVLLIFVLRTVFFGESGPVTLFEKEHNVTFSGPFMEEERNQDFKPILARILGKRNSESVMVTRKNIDRVLIEVMISNDGREEFLIERENGKWFGRKWELIENGA